MKAEAVVILKLTCECGKSMPFLILDSFGAKKKGKRPQQLEVTIPCRRSMWRKKTMSARCDSCGRVHFVHHRHGVVTMNLHGLKLRNKR